MLVNLTGRFAPAYRIKIGGYNPDIVKRSRGSGREYRPPVKYDHFKVCHNDRDPVTGNFIPALEIMKHYVAPEEPAAEGKPTSLNIMLFSNDIADVFDDWRALYMSRRCQCRTVDEFLDENDELFNPFNPGDYVGPIIQLARWDKTQKPVPTSLEVVDDEKEFALVKCPERHCYYTEQKQCKVNSILRCMIVEAPELGAVAEFRTTSVYSTMQLKKSLQMVHQLSVGHMAGLELALRLEPKTVEQGMVFVAHVVYPHGGLLELKEAATKFRTKELSFDRQMLIVEASVKHFDETEDEVAHIEAEFYEKDEDGEIAVEPETETVEREPAEETPGTFSLFS